MFNHATNQMMYDFVIFFEKLDHYRQVQHIEPLQKLVRTDVAVFLFTFLKFRFTFFYTFEMISWMFLHLWPLCFPP
jgi:2-polyprenyl-3-methyl-5-hydroxy-6-metoxy-1,4-benzoquinol methylase